MRTAIPIFILLVFAAAGGRPASAQLSTFDRGNSQSMLKQIKEDLTKNYYDPKFHGVEVEKLFAEAAERLKTAQSAGEASAILADTLLRLDDSHTKFYPPERLTRVDYGWTAMMIGDQPFVSWVKKGSDAERKGLAVGDRIQAWNRFGPTRANLWQIQYVYRHIRPQQLQRLVIEKPDGAQKTLDIESKVEKRAGGMILIDSESASASEVPARIMQIEKRATVIGDRSAGAVMTSLFYSHQLGQDMYGSGSIAFYGASITVGDHRMSDGFSLEKVGVTPDEVLLPTAADLAAGRDPVLARAITLLGGTMSAEQAGKFYPK